MELRDAIYGRRATRAFSQRLVAPETVDELLRAAVQAPSAMNLQPWLFVVVQNRAQLGRYSALAKAHLLAQAPADPVLSRYGAMLRDPLFDIFFDAGTLIVIAHAQRGSSSQADCWLAAQNLMLAAWGLGLGSCCIGFAVDLLNEPEIKSELSLPVEAEAVAPLVVGYPRGVPLPVPHAEPRVVHWSRPHRGE